MEITHINPPALAPARGYSQVVRVRGGSTVHVAGQGAYDAEGRLVGPGDYRAQARQAFRNVAAALAAAGARPEQVVSSTMYVKELRPEALEAFVRGMNEALDGRPFPPHASTLVGVQALAYPDMLVEISAIAVIEMCPDQAAAG
ncbi:MAG: RidA family protein [Pseudomonadales bacterium]|nr:RidA family protein [Pseudomonadales bacterium]